MFGSGRAPCIPRRRVGRRSWDHVADDVLISERPAEVEDRAVPGHWEGDLVIGLKRSAIGTLVERTTRFTMLIHLPREPGYGEQPRKKNGPALAGYRAVTMKNRLAASMTTLPETALPVADLGPRQRALRSRPVHRRDRYPGVLRRPEESVATGTKELLRQYFPKGTDLTRWSSDDLEAVAETLNARPRKILDWRTPAEAFDEHLRSLQQASVATTD